MITDNEPHRLAGVRLLALRTKRARARTTMALALACSAACSGERSGQKPPQQAAAPQQTSADVDTAPDSTPADSMSLAAVQSGAPRFAAGTYELVLDRDRPLFDDSLAVRDHVEQQLVWSAVDSARNWRDSVRLLDAYYKGLAGTPDDAFALGSARSAKDSADVARDLFEHLRCVEWRSGGTLTLHADGRFVRDEEMRSYCRGKTPAFTRRSHRQSEPTSLETCTIWEAPEPGIVPHLTCRSGRWWYGRIGYRYVGDTLTLNSDCDGRDTWALRVPERQARYAVAHSSDITRLDEC